MVPCTNTDTRKLDNLSTERWYISITSSTQTLSIMEFAWASNGEIPPFSSHSRTKDLLQPRGCVFQRPQWDLARCKSLLSIQHVFADGYHRELPAPTPNF